MIDLHKFSTAELLQLHADCGKISVIAHIGIGVEDDELLGVVNVHMLTSQLTILQNQILHILNLRDERQPQ